MPVSSTTLNLLVQDAGAMATGDAILERLELERLRISKRLAGAQMRRSKLGQFITPVNVARFMASMLEVHYQPEELNILDAGGGTGILTAATVVDICSRPKLERPAALRAIVWEVDDSFQDNISRTFEYCRAVCQEVGMEFKGELRQGNFIIESADLISGTPRLGAKECPPFHVAIINPPYRKLYGVSAERARLNALGMRTSNLYSAFVWLALRLLASGGELVAITPRSFMNGSYFRPFREALAEELSFRRIHVYDTRDVAFASDSVLQENVIFHGIRSGVPGPVKVTTSHSPDDDGFTERNIELREMISPNDPERIIRVAPDDTDARIAEQMRSLPCTLGDLNLSVSTGRVVGFRSKEHLYAEPRSGDAPFISPKHCRGGFVAWPQISGGKPNALAMTPGLDGDLLLPSGWYVLVNRFSAKEDRRRVVATLLDPDRVDGECVAFDNKLNVVHSTNAGLPEHLAKGLAVFLNSTVVDAYFRQFSGHTQVNAGDLRSLHFPRVAELTNLGRRISDVMPAQDDIDRMLKEESIIMSEENDAVAIKQRIRDALRILQDLGVQRGQLNERSALTLLALLDLAPGTNWSAATSPLRGVSEMMAWMRENYGRSYAPNTRETIRRFTLHQFEQMGLVHENPDQPDRPVNSPNYVYQVDSSVLSLIQVFGTEKWETELDRYLSLFSERNRLSERQRNMDLIEVTLPSGSTLDLTAGGQNILVKAIIEQFAPRFVPGGHMVYLGDASQKHLLYDSEYLRDLGVEVDPHGRMPDVVIHHVERDWLILIEGVTSHGPVNPLRHNQLKDLFAGSKCGLVFVTAFLDRSAMRQYLPSIAWETEVWVAEAPDHLIHFDGERFLGPYDSVNSE